MTRDKILHAARELFEEKGFDATTVRDIANKAEVNVALINYHFGSKELLLTTLIDELSNATHIKLSDINKSTADPVAKLQQAMDIMLDKTFANKKYYQMLHRELSTVQRPQLNEQIAKNLKRNRTELRYLIEEGQRLKVFRDDIDIELTLGTISGLLHQVTNSGLRDAFKDNDNKLKSRIRHHLFDLMLSFLKRK
ncbi:TetR/AcrR family transcriptional regulator [Chryseosolibacter indicus]|uniref:TetR/AcrR family transcriptional regulator n=1 Tax=Chryseosolibacter indicus TaxID=2782351 RepID=A0ABS5VXT8_9BACT|nr:TetR family transcriptional regulator [Chryseosolibacter indicus]MBT1706224.1 TetR/AcrR family transcriptional regulator [Chryseosolibacter indicus]